MSFFFCKKLDKDKEGDSSKDKEANSSRETVRKKPKCRK
jgi:hypothetical protein